jgi:nucleotidyltransferase substrate binding protein (TIGR01987 family)
MPTARQAYWQQIALFPTLEKSRMNTDIRWKQRLENFKKAVAQLEEFVQQPLLNKFERQGLIQCFEYSFELGWKTLKDYLENGGQDVATPRAAIQLAFQAGLIGDGHSWIDALQSAKIFGSRAEGNQHSSSDVDLALVGEQISLIEKVLVESFQVSSIL